MRPLISILSKEFKYKDSASTDVRTTFARARERMAAEKQTAIQAVDETTGRVQRIFEKRREKK